MELKTLATFLKVAETKNFSKAAVLLGYSQSAVTAQIHQIEAELGVQVFDRMGKTTSLTGPGQELIRYARQMLALDEAAKQAISASPITGGALKLGIAESLCISFLPNILHYYRTEYPDVELVIRSFEPKNMIQMLQNNEIDMIYTLDRHNSMDELVCPRELAEPILFIAPAKHPLVKADRIEIEDLIKEDFILTSSGSSYREALDQRLNQENKKIKSFLELGNTDVICQLVAKGFGLSFVPSYAARSYIQEGRVAVLDVIGYELQMYRQLLYHKDKWLTPAMRAMIGLLLRHDF